jgi:hypothetical protein
MAHRPTRFGEPLGAVRVLHPRRTHAGDPLLGRVVSERRLRSLVGLSGEQQTRALSTMLAKAAAG